MPAAAEAANRVTRYGCTLSFTINGDTANTASRLQGLTRTLHTSLVVADALIRAIRAATLSRRYSAT